MFITEDAKVHYGSVDDEMERWDFVITIQWYENAAEFVLFVSDSESLALDKYHETLMTMQAITTGAVWDAGYPTIRVYRDGKLAWETWPVTVDNEWFENSFNGFRR